MLKKCKWCKKEQEMKGKREFCPGEKCKNAWKYANRTGKLGNFKTTDSPVDDDGEIKKMFCDKLSKAAMKYWDRLSPVVIARGHLNVLSADAFAELCDLYSKLDEINDTINNNRNSLFQKNEKGEIKESVLSDLKRKYGKQLLDYCKVFYLTPLSNRGDFGLDENKPKIENDKSRFFE